MVGSDLDERQGAKAEGVAKAERQWGSDLSWCPRTVRVLCLSVCDIYTGGKRKYCCRCIVLQEARDDFIPFPWTGMSGKCLGFISLIWFWYIRMLLQSQFIPYIYTLSTTRKRKKNLSVRATWLMSNSGVHLTTQELRHLPSSKWSRRLLLQWSLFRLQRWLSG